MDTYTQPVPRNGSTGGWKRSDGLSKRRWRRGFSKLRRVDTWSQGDGYWGRKVNALLGRYVTPTIVMSDSADASVATERAVRASMDGGTLSPMVASVRGGGDVLPESQSEKIDVVHSIRETLTPKIRSLIPADKREGIGSLIGPEDLAAHRPARPSGRSLVSGLRERDGTLGLDAAVYPRPSEMLWRAKEIRSFVTELRHDASTGLSSNDRPGRIAGSIPCPTTFSRPSGATRRVRVWCLSSA